MKLLLALLLYSCVAYGQLQVRDDYGHVVALPAAAKRIVSLAPHLTELLYAAGAGERMVGALDYSDYPEEARRLPRVGSEASIDLEAVVALRPDLIVAWPNAGSLRAVNRLADLRIPVFRSEPRELDDIPRTLERLGSLSGTARQAANAADAFRARARALEERYSKRPSVRVFYQVWDRPLLTVNGQHVISKVMRLCGGENVFAGLPLIAPEVDREAVLRANPQVIVSSGASMEGWKAYSGLTAAAKGQLYAIAPELIQRHTPRLLDGAERLCRILDEVRARS